jgi:hypothetical protein
MNAYRTIADVTPTLTAEEEREFRRKCTVPRRPKLEAMENVMGGAFIVVAIILDLALYFLTRR